MTAAAVVHALADHGVRLAVEGSNLRARGPLTEADRALIREHKSALVALLASAESPPATPTDPDPAAHCERCGSPSWWRSPASPGWRCAYCEPRPVPLPEGFEALASGQWAPGTRPPADPDDDPPEPHALDPVAPRPPRPDDGRVQDAYGAWRTPAAHAAVAAFYAHHWTCTACRRAGRGYGDRCAEGARLHALTRGTDR